MITCSEYTQTDPLLSTPVSQPVKTFADAGTQVELISDSPGSANPGPSGHSSHVNQASRPADCNKFDKKKQESGENINTDSEPKKLTRLNKSIHQMRSRQMIHHFFPWM